MSEMQSSTPLDPGNPEFRADPFPTFRRLREEEPVHWSDAVGGWVLTRYSDVQAILRDTRLSSDRITPFFDSLSQQQRAGMKSLSDSLRKWTVFSDPPQHTRLRALFNKAFTSRSIERLRGGIEQIVQDLLAPALARGKIDLIADFAYPLPAVVICDMIGLPREDIAHIRIWSAAIEAFLGLARKPEEVYETARHNVEEMTGYFHRLIDEHRRRARDDILSDLIAASEGGERLSQDELIATCMMLVFAAHTTTTHLIGNGMLAFLRHPEALAALRNDLAPAKLATAVEELLRYDGPVQVARRVVREPMEIGGTQLSPGDIAFPMLNAANRDPEQFPEPDRLDLTRTDNRHIAFGYGAHFCPGAPLARMEGQIAFKAILSALEDIQLIAGVDWIESFGFRGLKALPLKFRTA